ncbi:PAS domain S-box protein, partial [Vibrio parahaemolyticus]|nr:PAS domain S-box protein [Vibrio parahaemolyticus]
AALVCAAGRSLHLAMRLGRATQRLRAEQALTRQVVDTALDCVVIFDSSGQITGFNRVAERVLGYDRDEVLGADAVQLLAPPEL